LTRERHLVSGSAVRSATMVRILDKQSAEFSIFTSEEWVPVMHRTRKLFPFSKGKQEYPHNGPKRRTHSDKWVRRWKLMLKNRKPEKRKKERKKKKKKKEKKSAPSKARGAERQLTVELGKYLNEGIQIVLSGVERGGRDFLGEQVMKGTNEE